jgi:hypothetical protein
MFFLNFGVCSICNFIVILTNPDNLSTGTGPEQMRITVSDRVLRACPMAGVSLCRTKYLIFWKAFEDVPYRVRSEMVDFGAHIIDGRAP